MRTIILIICLFSLSPLNAQSQKETFDSFMYEFGSDTDFQLERIKFPLEFVTWENPEEIGGNIVTRQITKDKWTHDYMYMNESYRAQIYDNFEGKLDDSDERLFQWIGVETGANVKYFFKRIEGKWFLIKKESLGD